MMNLPSIEEILYLIPILLISLSLHEFAHGYVSHKLGDPTPEQAGRLTINPLPHLDPMGSIAFIFFRIGWAKPVPVNPRYYSDPRQGMMYVGMAGPGANILLALISALLLRLGIIDIFLNFFGIGFPSNLFYSVIGFFRDFIFLNLVLAIFNLLPVPPLDGSKILRGVLPRKYDELLYNLEGPLGMMIILFLAFSGLLGRIIFPVAQNLFNLILFFP